METSQLDIGCSVTGIDAAKATKTQIKKLRDLLYQQPPDRPQGPEPRRSSLLRFRQEVRQPGSLPAGQLPPPRIPADLRLLERQEGRQADRRRPHRRLLALRHLLREGPQVHHHADAEGSAARCSARSTRFIDMAAVYAALPQAIKDKLAGARVPAQRHDALQGAHPGRSATTSSRSSPTIDQLCPASAPPGGDRAPLHQGEGALRQPRLHARYRRRARSTNWPAAEADLRLRRDRPASSAKFSGRWAT